MRPLIVWRNTGGHNSSYVTTFQEILKADNILVDQLSLKTVYRILSAPKILFSTVDNCLIVYFVFSILRSMIGRKTVGLCLNPIIKKTKISSKIKSFILYIIKNYLNAEIISIIPSYVHSDVDKYTNSWMYDPEFWDKPNMWNTKEPSHQVPIVGMVGIMNKNKNLQQLLQITKENSLQVILSGIINDNSRQITDKLRDAGAVITEKRLTETELIKTYQTCTHGWCCYAPAYDMSSGVVGRCIQLGLTPIIREGSVIQKILSTEGFTYQHPNSVHIDDDPNKIKRSILLMRIRRSSIDTLKTALL